MGRRIGVIIPAAGAGTRLGGISKSLIEIGNRPLITGILSLFAEIHDVKKICLAVHKDAILKFEELVKVMELDNLAEVVEGGKERAISVRRAYEHLQKYMAEDDLVCVHDAARPLLTKSDADSVIAAGWKYGAALLAVRIKDTLKLVDGKNFCSRTIDRSNVFGAQTPQVMLSKFLSRAYQSVNDFADVTDEIMLMEKIGVKAFVVESQHLNPKLTAPEDLELIRKLIS